MKFIVAQIGARHHYAIPRMFAKCGCLEALYTDSCSNQGAGRLLALLPCLARNGAVGKLLQRNITGIPRERIRSTDRLLWHQLFVPQASDTFTKSDQAGVNFSRDMLVWGTRGATHIYSMFGEGIEFLRVARERGVQVCVDVFLTPIAHRIIAEERSRFPQWEGKAESFDPRLEPRIREIIELADVLLCPGQNVVDGLKAFGPHVVEKVRVVPYGSGANFAGRINQPMVGRVLFAGTADLRKGIHYFAAAAKWLGSRGYEFRVAGGVTDKIRRLPDCGALNFLGRIPRDQMQEEMLRADVLVLPTLAEGSASVISESLVARLPVITTRSAGSLVVDGQSGRLVPERDAETLASAIESVVADRTYREDLAAGTRRIAAMLSEDEWSRRLLAAVSEPPKKMSKSQPA